MFTREPNDYEQLYTPNADGVEDRGENDQLDVYHEFNNENITRADDGRYQVKVPSIPGQSLPNSNLEQSRKRLVNVCKKIERDEKNFGLVGDSSENPCVLNDGKEREDMNEEIEGHENKPERLRKLKAVTAEETKEGQGDEDENAYDNSDQNETFELMDESGAQESGKKLKGNEVENLEENGIKTKGKVKSNVVSQGNTKETSSVEKTIERKKKKRKITDENRMKEKSKKSKKAKLVKNGTDEDNIIGSDVSDLEKFKVETTAILEGAKLPLHKWESNVESSQEEEQILTPNTMLWGQNSYALGDLSEEEDRNEVGSLYKRLTMARQHAWSRWQREYIHGLMGVSSVTIWNDLVCPLVCFLEIRSVLKEDQGRHNESTKDNDKLKERPERKAAKIAKVNFKEQLKDD
ncbi:Hypothetical predicted protein [Paramuricea clavata]|uniref:Uncharacterized protein n=1 Tax=Paramuricea clavata TaxID=317549 RepID=A0A6S7IDJ8_PARCT|nr:Hypothetical predicted protein [Paramuricea clavata]